MSLRQVFSPKIVNWSIVRAFSQSSAGAPAKPAAPPPPKPEDKATGLSTNCVRAESGPVGPGASADGQYKVPEYFRFNKTSYFEAEIEMANYRCPQPDAGRKS